MSTSTALKLYEASEFTAFDPECEAAIALRTNTEGEGFGQQDLIRVKMPTGGGTIWTIEGVSGPEAVGAIEGICVFKGYKGLIWPTLEEEKEKHPPVVVSNDLITGKLNVKRDEVPPEMMETLDKYEVDGMPGVYRWADLPYCQWNTGKNGRGKYAKEHMLLFMLRAQLGEVLPLYIQAGVASLATLKRFFLRLPVQYHCAYISLALKAKENDDGKPYCEILPTLKGKIPQEFWGRIETEYKDKLKKSHEAGLIDVGKDSPEE